MTAQDERETYRLAAISIATLATRPISADTFVYVPGREGLSIRAVLWWAGSDEGRQTLPPDIRANLMELATEIL